MGRYVYRVYYANDTLNLEKHPIIYENKHCIYYKVARKNLLNYILKSGGYQECLSSIKELRFKNIKNVDVIVLEEPPLIEIKKMAESIVAKNKERKIATLIDKINNCKASIEKLQKELESIK